MFGMNSTPVRSGCSHKTEKGFGPHYDSETFVCVVDILPSRRSWSLWANLVGRARLC